MKPKAPHTGAARPIKASAKSKEQARNEAFENAEGNPAAGPTGANEAVRKGALFSTGASGAIGNAEPVRQAHTHSIPADDARSSSGKAEALRKMHTHSRSVE